MKKLISILAMTFGCLGIVFCLASAVASWTVASRLNRVNERIFSLADESLGKVQNRVNDAQTSIQDYALTAKRLASGSTNNGTDLTAENRQREARRYIEGLARFFNRTEGSLEQIVASLRHAQELSGLGMDLVASSYPERLAELADDLTELQQKLAISGKSLDLLTAKLDGESPLLESVSEVLQTTATKLDTTSSRLQTFSTRLNELRATTLELESRMNTYITYAAFAFIFLIGWSGAGQASLLWLGWNSMARRRKTRANDNPQGT